MNIEELATIYHFPGVDIKAPLLKTTESKKSEPPFKLPIYTEDLAQIAEIREEEENNIKKKKSKGKVKSGVTSLPAEDEGSSVKNDLREAIKRVEKNKESAVVVVTPPSPEDKNKPSASSNVGPPPNLPV